MRILFPILLLAGCVGVADDMADDLATSESDLDIVSVPLTRIWFSFSQGNGQTTNQRLSNVQAGTSIRVGTCGMADAAFAGPNQLRLWNLTTNTEITDVIRTRCGNSNITSYGQQINYTVPYDMSIELRAGCAGPWSCSGAVVLHNHLDATPRIANVKQAFLRIRSDAPALGKSSDIDERVQGVSFDGGFGGKYHIQGIARTYNRTHHDIVWSTSVKKEATPALETMYFTKLGTKDPLLYSRSMRFGSNAYPQIYAQDKVEYGSHAAVYDDLDDVPDDRGFDHAGGLQSIGNYVFTASQFVVLPCDPYANPLCPPWHDNNLPESGQTSQVVGYDISLSAPEPRLLVERKDIESGWVAIGKLPNTAKVPAMLAGGYLIAVSDHNRISLYAIASDGCTGYASLADVIPFRDAGTTVPDRRCLSTGRSPHTVGDKRPVELVGCVKKDDSDPGCPELVTMWADGSHMLINFPNEDDLQSANFVTQTDGTLYLLAFVGYPSTGVEGPNSHIELWRVVFGTPSGIATAQSLLPDGTTCSQLVCLVRDGTLAARDTAKYMEHDGIDGNMFRYGGSSYIVGNATPANEGIYIYASDHYLHESPRALWWNEF